jgi:hypothetical protein
MAPHGSIPPADNGINNRTTSESTPNTMEDELARRNGIKVFKEVVMVRLQASSGPPPIDAPALIKALIATFESTRAKTWIIQQNITEPKAIKSEKAIPIGDKLKEYYSATDLMTRGTPTDR